MCQWPGTRGPSLPECSRVSLAWSASAKRGRPKHAGDAASGHAARTRACFGKGCARRCPNRMCARPMPRSAGGSKHENSPVGRQASRGRTGEPQSVLRVIRDCLNGKLSYRRMRLDPRLRPGERNAPLMTCPPIIHPDLHCCSQNVSPKPAKASEVRLLNSG